jgi:hypothetical protein
MMEGMESLGFNKTWTLLIGFGELVGLIALICQIVMPSNKECWCGLLIILCCRRIDGPFCTLTLLRHCRRGVACDGQSF